MTLSRINFSQTIRPFDDNQLFGDGAPGLNLDPPYQRGVVWTLSQRVALIQSLLQGLPIGVVFINRREHDYVLPASVVDGKQRIITIRSFLKDGFSVPRRWFPAEDVSQMYSSASGVLFGELSEVARRRFMVRGQIAVYETSLPTVEEEADLYLRINFGGEPQGDDDRERAQGVRNG